MSRVLARGAPAPVFARPWAAGIARGEAPSMPSAVQTNFRIRKNFGKIEQLVDIPNLIDIQKQSYEKFLQAHIDPDKREDFGLQGVFKSVFPIKDFQGTAALEFVSYHLEKPKYDVDECHQRGMTYAAPIKVMIRLVAWDKDEATGTQVIKAIKEQEVYFGEIPLMTENGTFIINGTERVIVSQLHRSPGAFFHSEDKTLFVAQIIPYRGSWVEFEYDAKNLLYVRIDRKRKFLATVFLRALGLRGADEIIRSFYTVDRLMFKNGAMSWAVGESLIGMRAAKELKAGSDTATGAGKKINANAIAALKKAGVASVEVADAELDGAFAATDDAAPA